MNFHDIESWVNFLEQYNRKHDNQFQKQNTIKRYKLKKNESIVEAEFTEIKTEQKPSIQENKNV